MADHDHRVAFPEALEAFLGRTDELKVVLGSQAAAGVDALGARIREGLAARERGDVLGAVARIVEAMRMLAELASRSDAAEGPMLRAMAERFAAALVHGTVAEAREHAETMRVRSGTTLIPRK
ncbi:MAG: hypothetical protein KIT14_20760 [bacterium]|nr:hypothetical protein [bacterium]